MNLLDKIIFWLSKPTRLESLQQQILTNQETIMGQLEDLVTALDAETTKVAEKIDKLRADLADAINAGKTPDPATLAALTSISDRLKALGADPQDPIPAEPGV